jgi:NitT/TauT family transport system substrate-binding protein
MRKLVLETTAPFQGLPELVADKEGLFAKEGLEIEWVERESDDKSTRVDVNSPKGLDPFSSHGKMLEQGKADLYNACEWGNYCRVQDTKVGSRQVGRRGIVTYAAIVVRPDSPVYTAQQLAGRTVGVPFYFGTHYLALHLLEGFMPREQIRLCCTSNGSRQRFDAMMRGEIEATTLTEPYVTLAEKHGCRLICEAFYHGTEVASDRSTPTAPPTCITSSTTTKRKIRRSARSSRKTCVRAASWSAIRRRSRSTKCSTRMTGSRAGACWSRRRRRCNSSICKCSRQPTPLRRSDRSAATSGPRRPCGLKEFRLVSSDCRRPACRAGNRPAPTMETATAVARSASPRAPAPSSAVALRLQPCAAEASFAPPDASASQP